jgi:hypothetical protein
VIAKNAKDMGACRDALLSTSAKKGWTDNVTIALCQIVSGGTIPKRNIRLIEYPKQMVDTLQNNNN